MNKYVAAALTVAIAIGPASALDAGLGGKLGGVGVSAGVSVGSKGASVAGGASVDGVGGASLGGSVSAGKGSLGAGLGVGGNLGGASGGLSTGVGDRSSGLGTAPGGKPGNPALGSGQVATAGITPATAKAASQFAILPRALRPSGTGRDGSAPTINGYPLVFVAPLKAKPGIPKAVVRACRTAIASAAAPLGAVRVNAVSAGTLQQFRGALTARIEVRIHYARQGGIEVRQARVGCRLDAAGRVTAVT
jgi:hypothetical protein